MSNPRIIGIGTANPVLRLTQEQSFHAVGYQSERIRKMFLNSDIDYLHFYLEGDLNREESSDQLNQRYLRGAMKTGCRAIVNCLATAERTVQDVDFLAVVPAPAMYVRIWAAARSPTWRSGTTFRGLLSWGLGCAGAVPTLQRAADFVRADPRRVALMVAVEISNQTNRGDCYVHTCSVA